jgi:ketosteroid isomerase-like protein
MGVRGPHDDFEKAEGSIRAAYARFNEAQELDEIRRDYISDELEYVTRHGTFHGPDQFLSEFGVQREKWRLENDVEEVIDAGDGAIVVFVKAKRIDRDSGEVVWKAWPAIVCRVHDGRFVFFEGYIDRRKALDDLGVEQG